MSFRALPRPDIFISRTSVLLTASEASADPVTFMGMISFTSLSDLISPVCHLQHAAILTSGPPHKPDVSPMTIYLIQQSLLFSTAIMSQMPPDDLIPICMDQQHG